MDINNLVKEFQNFCKLSGGTFEYSLFPVCRKLDYEIRLEYSAIDKDYLGYLSIKIISSKNDFEFINIKEAKLLNVKRDLDLDKNGEVSLYVLSILTDKGNLYIKRSSKEDKLFIVFESKNLNYQSSILF